MKFAAEMQKLQAGNDAKRAMPATVVDKSARSPLLEHRPAAAQCQASLAPRFQVTCVDDKCQAALRKSRMPGMVLGTSETVEVRRCRN